MGLSYRTNIVLADDCFVLRGYKAALAKGWCRLFFSHLPLDQLRSPISWILLISVHKTARYPDFHPLHRAAPFRTNSYGFSDSGFSVVSGSAEPVVKDFTPIRS